MKELICVIFLFICTEISFEEDSMLAVFRKYQRILFITISITVIASFILVGDYGRRATSKEEAQTVAFIAIDGTKVMQSELDTMTRVITEGNPILTDSFLHSDLVKTNLIWHIFSFHNKSLREDLSRKYEKELQYVPYQHSQIPFLNLYQSWNYLNPKLPKAWDRFKSNKDIHSKEFFIARAELYLAQKSINSNYLKKLMHYQEQQFLGPQATEVLSQDLSVFGYKSITDWFDEKTIYQWMQTVWNAAILAEQKGYLVTPGEAEALYSYTKDQKGYDFNSALQAIHLSEKQLRSICAKICLFRKLFEETGSRVLIDPLFYDQFIQKATEKVSLEVYELPKEMLFSDLQSLKEFDTYLSLISPKYQQGKLPSKFYTAEELAKACPQLVQKSYTVDIGSISLKQLQAKIGIKETLQWTLLESNQRNLEKKFPELMSEKQNSSQQSLADIIQKLPADKRESVESYIRNEIVKAHPEWVTDALDELKLEKTTLQIPLKGYIANIPEIKNTPSFINLLDEAPLASEEEQTLSEESLNALKLLSEYRTDSDKVYRIRILKKDPSLSVMLFKDARNRKITQKLLHKRLQKHYEAIRDTASEKYKENEKWKPLSKVEPIVSKDLFQDLFKTIGWGTKGKTEAQASSEFMNLYLEKLKSNVIQEVSKENSNTLAVQWQLAKQNLSLQRSDSHPFLALEEVFNTSLNTFSPVLKKSDNSMYFYKVLEKRAGSTDSSTLVMKQHKNLSNEVKAHILQSILELQHAGEVHVL